MAVWSKFTPDILPHVIGAPDPLITQNLRRVAQDFFHRTRAWSPWLDEIVSQASVTEYDFELPPESNVVRVEKATLDSKPISVLGSREIATQAVSQAQTPGITTYDRKTFIVRLPQVAAGLPIGMRVSLKPNDTATGIPDDLFEQFGLHLAHGTLAKLMLIPKTDFSNAELAMMYSGLYESAVATKAVEAYKSFSPTTPRARVSWC